MFQSITIIHLLFKSVFECKGDPQKALLKAVVKSRFHAGHYRQYLFTCKVSRYCLLALHGSTTYKSNNYYVCLIDVLVKSIMGTRNGNSGDYTGFPMRLTSQQRSDPGPTFQCLRRWPSTGPALG